MKFTKTLIVLAVCSVATLSAAQDTLFITQEDFTVWTVPNGGVTIGTGTTGDTDLSAVCGLGNPTAAGANGVPGAMELSGITSNHALVQSLSNTNANFIQTIQGGNSISFDLTLTGGTGTQFDPVLVINSNSGFNTYDAKYSDNSLGVHHYSIDYNGSAILPTSYLYIGFYFNTDTTSSFSLDNVEVNAVPAPTALLPLGLGTIGLIVLRRRK